MIRPLLSLASPGGAHARLSILIFHRVSPEPDPLFPEEVDASRFEEICGWLRSWFNVLPLGEAVQRLYEGSLPPRTAVITFDDGYADNRTVAAPILQRFGLPCTFFIATGFLDGGCMWNDVIIESLRRTVRPRLDVSGLDMPESSIEPGSALQRRALVDRLIGHAKYLPLERRSAFVEALSERAGVAPPTDLMMSSNQVRELRQLGFEVGAHTVSHPILSRLGADQARREIVTSKRSLEALLGEKVGLFAYPNGKAKSDYSAEAVELAREAGFDAAVSTNWGVNTAGSDRFQLARYTPWDRARTRFAMRLLRNLRRDAARV